MGDPHVLLVEGADDKHVLWSLLTHHDIPDVFKIREKKGIDILLETLEVEIDASDLERLGVVVDADEHLDRRWQAIRGTLLKAGYLDVPADPHPDGTIVTRDRPPVVGVWIMPDNTLPGMLEHFIGFLVPSEDPLWEKARSNVDEIPEDHCRFAEQHRAKAHIHTWLAWQSDPGTPLGQAITKRYLDADSEHARRLIAWINRLFVNDVE